MKNGDESNFVSVKRETCFSAWVYLHAVNYVKQLNVSEKLETWLAV
jgi:hypothetical protein